MDILYEKFGYEIKLLERKHGTEMFEMLSSIRLPKRIGKSADQYASLRRALKNEIRFAIEEKNYNSVGIFENDRLIGISFNSVNTKINQPWLGYFYIEPGKRNGKAGVVLMNYLLNHLYDGYIMRMKTSLDEPYSKHIRMLPDLIGYAVFKEGFKEKLSRICDTGSKEEKPCQH